MASLKCLFLHLLADDSDNVLKHIAHDPVGKSKADHVIPEPLGEFYNMKKLGYVSGRVQNYPQVEGSQQDKHSSQQVVFVDGIPEGLTDAEDLNHKDVLHQTCSEYHCVVVALRVIITSCCIVDHNWLIPVLVDQSCVADNQENRH